MKDSDGAVRSLEKAIQLLELLSQQEEALDLTTLSKKSGLPKSTTLRLLSTLSKHNLIHQDKSNCRYNLGWYLISLGKSSKKAFNLINFSYIYLKELVQLTGESACLSIMQGDHAVYIDQFLSSGIIKAIPDIGTRLHLHCSSSGKAFLSTFTQEKQDKIINQIKFVKKTDHTITSVEHLVAELKNVKDKGYAFDNEETEMGGRCVAAPLFNSAGKAIAAFSIIGPTSRISVNELERFGKIVSDTAVKASKALGYTG